MRNNIEIYGMKKRDAIKVETEINKLLRGTPYANDYVITSVRSSVRDRSRKRKPFLRLILIGEHMIDIIVELKKLGMDIEVPPISLFFIPAEN